MKGDDTLYPTAATNELQSKVKFVTVPEKKKPESRNSGLYNNSLDSSLESGKNGQSVTPILPDAPNLYKHIGASLENLGYFIIPRSVTSDPRYKSAPMKYQKVLHILFEYVAFAPTTHAIGTEIIQISIGQFCVSEAHLSKLCNEGVKYEDDLITKTIVHRAIQFWKKCKIVNQQVNRSKNIITITVPDFYDRYKKKGESQSESQVNRPRITKEEDKELKEDNISLDAVASSDVAIAPSEPKKVSSSPKKRKKVEKAPLVERDVGVFTSDIAHQKLIDQRGSEELVKQVYSEMSIWKAQSGIGKRDDYRTASNWDLKPKYQGKQPYQKPQPKYNHDTSPRNPKNSISFAEEV